MIPINRHLAAIFLHGFAVVVLVVLLVWHINAQAQGAKPNILLIVLDDAGYNDIDGFYDGASVDRGITPNLTELAQQGVRFTRFYADATCRPARLSLLTGKQAARVASLPDLRGISPEVETLADKLQSLGYRTHHIGKWHLGDVERLAWPDQQGFQTWQGFLNQFLLRGPNDAGDKVYRRPSYNNPWLQVNGAAPQEFQGHLSDILADAAIEKIHAFANRQQPWFINYWLFAPHHPATASQVFLAQFPDTPAGRYQAMLKQMDASIGRVLQALKGSGQSDNTVVVVLSDNGGTNTDMDNNFPFAGDKGQHLEGALRTPMMMRLPIQKEDMQKKQGSVYDGITAIYDLYPTLLKLVQPELNLPQDLDGVDLLPLLQKDLPRPAQALFWEQASVFHYSYSMLSEDGRWRYSNGELFDLNKSQGKPEFIWPQPLRFLSQVKWQRRETMHQQFVLWRDEVHRVPVTIEPQPETRAYQVTGESLRRAPGYGGLTLRAEIRPDVGMDSLQGTLLEQAGFWQADFDESHLRLVINGEELLTQSLQIKPCNKLVLSTYYVRSKLHSADDKAVWLVYWNDQLVGEKELIRPPQIRGDFSEPTWLGTNSQGQQPLNAVLTQPAFYNDVYYQHDPWQVNRDPFSLASELCLDQR